MAPPKNPNDQQKKKKKGQVPAHQNTFAFKHNIKSKVTAKILASPNVHVCRRCRDKIVWRKQYRKYKPLTQPGTCNGCKKRNVLAAYHTICESCSIQSNKAKEVIQVELALLALKEKQQEEQQPPPKLRACAMCVKEIALPDPDGEQENNDLIESMGRIRLRERRSLERQIAKDANKSATSSDSPEHNEEEDQESQGSADGEANDDYEEDPFLKAVGGADKLLSGEAYQQKLLEQQNV
jgi:hypothetical protein